MFKRMFPYGSPQSLLIVPIALLPFLCLFVIAILIGGCSPIDATTPLSAHLAQAPSLAPTLYPTFTPTTAPTILTVRQGETWNLRTEPSETATIITVIEGGQDCKINAREVWYFATCGKYTGWINPAAFLRQPTP